MRGELLRGRRTNHVHLDVEVLGSTMTFCGKCGSDTNHALLELNLKMCGKCDTVTVRPPQRDVDRYEVAWLIWCYMEGYTSPEDRAILTNWMREPDEKLTVHDRHTRQVLLTAADLIVSAAR